MQHNIHRIAALAQQVRAIEAHGGRVPDRVRAVLNRFKGMSQQELSDTMQDWLSVRDEMEALVKPVEDAMRFERQRSEWYKHSQFVASKK